ELVYPDERRLQRIENTADILERREERVRRFDVEVGAVDDADGVELGEVAIGIVAGYRETDETGFDHARRVERGDDRRIVACHQNHRIRLDDLSGSNGHASGKLLVLDHTVVQQRNRGLDQAERALLIWCEAPDA